MDLEQFENELFSRLSELDFVEKWKITRKRTTLKVKVFLKKKSFLSVFYNIVLRVQSFALIINNERVWGIDHDNRFGWHEHPLTNPKSHVTVNPHTIEEVVLKLRIIWDKVNNTNNE